MNIFDKNGQQIDVGDTVEYPSGYGYTSGVVDRITRKLFRKRDKGKYTYRTEIKTSIHLNSVAVTRLDRVKIIKKYGE